MIKMKKLASMLCAIAMAVSASPMIPVHAADADDGILLQADFETKKKTVLDIDYEGTVPTFSKFEGGYVPKNETAGDETNHYGHINASEGIGYWAADSFNGGYALTESIASGEWTVSFKFNVKKFGNANSNISLVNIADCPKTDTDLGYTRYHVFNQFKLISHTGDTITVNDAELSGDITPTVDNWYNYKMTFDKTNKTYSVEISDGDGEKATGSGTISQTLAFDGLMFGSAIETYIDDIKIEGDYVNAPEMVKLPDWKSTYSFNNGYATIHDDKGWSFGGFKFKKAMTEGQYDLSFDIQIASCNSGYGAVYLTDADHGGNEQYNAFRLIDKNSDGKLVVGGNVVSGDYDITKWLTYKLHINRTTGAYTVTVTQKDDSSKTGTTSGTNLPNTDFIYIMFGTGCKINIDNIDVREYHDVPTIVSAKFVDGEGDEVFKPDPNTKAMKITFTEPMDKTSLDDGVTFGGSQPPTVGTRTLSDDGKTYTITFATTIAEGHNFRVMFAGTVKSTYNKNLAMVVKTYTANPTGVLLDVDYDITTAEFIPLPDANGSQITVADGYATISKSYAFGGYKLKEALGSGKYTIDFDFNISELTKAGGLYVKNTSGEAQPKHFQLMHVDADGKLNAGGYYEYGGSYNCVNSVPLSGLSFETDKWYSYHMEVNGSSYEATVTERENESNKGTASGNNFPTNGVQYLVMGWQAAYSIDNILIAKESAFEVEKVEFLNKNGESTAVTDDSGNTTVGMLTDKIVITMTENIDEATKEEAFIYDQSNNDWVTGFNVSVDGKKITFSDLSLTAGNEYNVGVGTNLKSETSGKTLADEYGKEITMGDDVQKINSISFSTNGTKVIVNAENSKAAYEVTLILAYYDASGLLKVNPVQVTIAKGECGDFEANATVETVSGATEVKAMLWKSLTSCEPLVPSVSK